MLMKNKFRILFLSSEIAPFAKTGGLADVSSSLPKALFDAGHDVRVIMPKYGLISERKYILREVIRLKKIPVRMGGVEYNTSARSAFIPNSKVQVYFLESKHLYGRNDLYVDSASGKDFPDNAERFMLLSRAALEIIRLLHWQPQIIHCNDWQTAMVPWLLKHEYSQDPIFTGMRTLLSVHNMVYQGSFGQELIHKLGLDAVGAEALAETIIYDRINFLKTGLVTADAVTTVSPTYALEIQQDQVLGAGLQDVLKKRSEDIYGILNGVDESIWNPETDAYLPSRYSANDCEPKTVNKKALLSQAGLSFDEQTPLIGIVSRLVDQKGFDLIAEVIDKLMSLKCQLIVLGQGEEKYHRFFQDAAKRFPEQLAVFLTFDESLAHLIEAGADIFLMPSRFEPCGLNQMYSLKYGTVPVVRKTGGLADTVIDFVADPEKGNGFVFEAYDGNALLSALQNAFKAFQDAKTWRKIQKRGMKADFSWKTVAENYVKVYQKILAV